MVRSVAGTTRPLPAVCLLAVVLSFCVLSPAAGRADVVAVDPGPIARDSMIVGTGQNLPPLGGDHTYFVSPGPDQIKYYADGAVRADQADVAAAALRRVQLWIRQHCDSTRPAAVRRCAATVVFDIDETLLNNFSMWTATGAAAGRAPSVRAEPAAAVCTPTNQPVQQLWRRLQVLGVRTAIVTGRDGLQRADTVSCLQQRGITGWSSLTLRSAAQEDLSAGRYKAQVRRGLRRAGLRIVASVGDQVSDMAYGVLGYGFLMPNPIYWIP